MAKKKIGGILIEEASGVSEYVRADVESATFGNIPIVDAESGWDDIETYPIKPTQGMGLKQVKYSAPPGSQLRLRSESINGPMHHATIWEVTSKGIPKTMPLVGHEFGGHEICAIKLQRRAGHQGTASLEFQMYGEGFEDAPPSNV